MCKNPRCESIRITVYANDTKDTDMRCRRAASMRVDGHYYCMQHAGQLALNILSKARQMGNTGPVVATILGRMRGEENQGAQGNDHGSSEAEGTGTTT